MSIFERYEIVALSKRQLNKLSNDTKRIKIELLLLYFCKYAKKRIVYFLIIILLVFYKLFCPISQNNFADMMYLLLWCFI